MHCRLLKTAKPSSAPKGESDMNAQTRMEQAEAHRNELCSQVTGYWDAGAEPTETLLNSLRFAEERLDAAKDAVRQEARKRINWEEYFSGMD